VNLLVAMSLCGLWHGAAWNFVLWGAYHGMGLVVRRMWLQFRGAEPGSAAVASRVPGVSWALTLVFVMIGWVFFRADSISSAVLILQRMFWPFTGVNWIYPFAVFVIACAAVVHALSISRWARALELPENAWYSQAVLFSLLLLTIVFLPEGFRPFIYSGF